MASRNDTKVKEGARHLAAGEKCLQTGFFKWKPDFEGAAQAFKDAANCFKVARAHEEAKSAFVKAATATESSGSDFHAAKYFEQAAMMAKELKQGKEAAEYFHRAGLLFRESGSVDTAGIMLDRAGKILEPLDGSKALDMYMTAAELSEDCDKLRQATESLAKAVQLMVKYRKFEDCIKAMEHQLVLYDKLSNYQVMHKVALSVILIQLCRDDSVAAERFLRQACSMDGFGDSDAAVLAEELLQAYDTGDAEAMAKATSDQYFSFISNEIAKLARALRGPQDLAPPEAAVEKDSLPSYKRSEKSSAEAEARPFAAKSTPVKAAEDRAALFGDAPPPVKTNAQATAPSSAPKESRPAERTQPRASAGSKKPTGDDRAALFGDSNDDKKPAADNRTAHRSASDEPPAANRDALLGGTGAAANSASPSAAESTPVQAAGNSEESAMEAEASPAATATDEAAGEDEKLFEDEEFEEGDLC